MDYLGGGGGGGGGKSNVGPSPKLLGVGPGSSGPPLPTPMAKRHLNTGNI